MRCALFTSLLLLLCLCFTGCTATMGRYVNEDALTLQLQVQQTKSLDVPVRFFDDDLSSRYHSHGMGIINDQETFSRLWDVYTKESTALPPSIDFQEYALLFVYDAEYYNFIKIIGLNVWQGIANPIIQKTNWKLSIHGNEQMRKIRESEGATLPEPKVNVAFLQIPRHRKDRPGVTAILVDGAASDASENRVIPVPSHP